MYYEKFGWKAPHISKLNDYVVEIDISAGSPARYVTFFDLKTRKKSDGIWNPNLIEKDRIVYFGDRFDTLIVSDIFDKRKFYKEIKRPFSPCAAASNAVLKAKFVNDNKLFIDYLMGPNFTEETEIINLNEVEKAKLPKQLIDNEGREQYKISDLEDRLINNGYLFSLGEAYWVADQGPAIIPYLDYLLSKQKYYEEKNGYAVGAFPFNVVWALSQIGGKEAEKTLLKYQNSADTNLALKALRLRRKDKGLGVMITEDVVYRKASNKSPVIDQVKEGEVVRGLKTGIVNNNEEGARGGPAIFDYIEVPSKNIKGYIQRAGDDFLPYY